MSYIDLGLVGLTGQSCAFGDRTLVWQVAGEKGLGKAKVQMLPRNVPGQQGLEWGEIKGGKWISAFCMELRKAKCNGHSAHGKGLWSCIN